MQRFSPIMMNVMDQMTARDKMIGMAGQWLLPLFPERVSKLENGGFTLSNFDYGRSKLEHLLRFGLVYKALKSGDLNQLAQYHENYWKGEAGTEYHERYQFEFEETFLPKFSYLIDLINQIGVKEGGYETLFEIGSGSGQLLDHLATHLTASHRFVGIDLSPQTVEYCKLKYGRENVQFVAADGDQYVRDNGQPKSIYLSHRGVLEYFPKERVRSLFAYIAEQYAPNLLVIIEPVGTAHNLMTTTQSQPYSNEYSFSHNYPHLIQSAGFDILHTDMQPCTPKYNLLAVVAQCHSHQGK